MKPWRMRWAARLTVPPRVSDWSTCASSPWVLNHTTGISEGDPDCDGTGERHRRHVSIERHGGAEWKLVGSDDREQPDADGPGRKAKQPAADRQQRCLKSMASRAHVPAAGPEGLPDGQLLGAAACADQEQVDKVDSAHEEQKQHGALEKQEHRANLAHVVLVQEAHARVEAGSDEQLGIGARP